ncbi:MAG: hypothetical protein RJA57_1010 [Bacteroidota bacterium]|jgi:beta-lactamase class A
MKRLIHFIVCCLFCTGINAQKSDARLESRIRELVAGFQGEVGIYVKNLRTGTTISIAADTLFPTASIVKVPILLGIVHRVHLGELHYDSLFIYHDSLRYEGEDILGSFRSGEPISLKKLLMLMLTTSDNTASLWLQRIAGTGTRVNHILDSLGFRDTRINSRTPGREANRARYQWGQTTPREMGLLFERIYRNELFSPSACERMMRLLGRNFWDEDEGLSQIPPTIEVFSKNGCVNASRSEVMLVNAPRNPFLLCLFTKNNRDQRWTHDNEAWTLARNLTRMVWDHYDR